MKAAALVDRKEPTTRDRILEAAILRFSAHSYETTGLRDIAGDVGVDVAYVHRCFGSKERLFDEAVRATIKSDQIRQCDRRDLPAMLAGEMLKTRTAGEVRPLDIAVRSFSSPDASRVLSDIAETDFIDPLTERLGHVSTSQAIVLMAFMAGVGILHDIMGATARNEDEQHVLAALIEKTIEGILDAKPAASG